MHQPEETSSDNSSISSVTTVNLGISKINEAYNNPLDFFEAIVNPSDLFMSSKIWLLSNPDIIIIDDMKIPDSVKIVEDTCGYKKAISTKNFNKGEIVYSIPLMKIKHSNIIIYKLDNKNYVLNNITHTINRNDYRLFYYFDIFINHSCSPNIRYNDDEIFEYYDKNNHDDDNQILYNAIATVDIYIGDELKSDYTNFDNMNDCEKFECNCGSENCKKII